MKWTFEPGHTAAEFCVRHMMVTWVRGHFKNVKGTMEFDLNDQARSSAEAVIDANQLWTGEPDRDAHLKSADFLDVARHPQILFKSSSVQQVGASQFQLAGNLTIRGVTRPVAVDVTYLGEWQTPYWVGAEDKGPITRAGFHATMRIDRNDFGVSWNSALDHGGIVVGNDVWIEIDVEALRDKP